MLRTDTAHAVELAVGELEVRRGEPPGRLRALLAGTTSFDDVLERIADVLGDPTSGAQLGWLVPIGAFGIIDYIGATAADPLTSHLAVCRYLDTVASPDMRYVYAHRWVCAQADGALHRDFLAALLVPRGRDALGREPFCTLRLSAIGVPGWMREELDTISVIEGEAGVELRCDTLHCPLASADPRLHDILCAAAQSLGYGRIEPTLVERIEAVLNARLPFGRPNVDDLAVLVRMSPRTLRRRLEQEGTTPQQVIDRILSRRAQAMLQGGAAVKQVAHDLGFSDTSAFSRAFTRWTGHRPSAFLPDT
ncbi:MAG: helix-turn-helix transcriptional regulator [Myxococcota bacterium]